MNAIAIVLCVAVLPSGVHIKKERKQLACNSIEQIRKEAKKYKLSPALIAALIYVESGWKRTAVSPKGACGLTQVLPKYTGGRLTGKKYSCRELKNPRTSIRVGVRILNFWINDYGRGNLRVGLCGYSSGYRCKGRYPLRNGMRYARKVLALKKRIEKQQK